MDVKNVCDRCGKTFSKPSNMRHHQKSVHHVLDSKDFNIKCLSCDFTSFKIQSLRSHLEEEHQFSQEVEQLTFTQINDFYNWKKNVEIITSYSWVKHYGKVETNGEKLTVYYCNRSGKQRLLPKNERKRTLKSQGSRKIGSTCTSTIIVKQAPVAINVKFYKTHYGHELNLAHVPLPPEAKNKIASQLLQGIPPTEILDKIRESVDSEFQRIHLCTLKDINNIGMEYSVSDKIVKDSNDAISIELWVQEMQEKPDNCVTLYKAQNIISAEAGIYTQDFLLAIMSHAQSEMLKSFGNNGIICMDATHGTNPYDFKLISIVVVDDFGEGFPVAFLFSNREDYTVLKYFIKSIKEKVGQNINAKVFMSDDAEQYYSAWSAVMTATDTKKLICAWHVDRAWRGKIHSIKNKNKQEEVYKTLCMLRQETNIETFDKYLKSFCILFQTDDELKDFGTYFVNSYANRVNVWSTCHRTGTMINTNMYLESMHKIIKYIYLRGTTCQRLDKTVSVLQKFIKNKQFDRIIKLTARFHP